MLYAIPVQVKQIPKEREVMSACNTESVVTDSILQPRSPSAAKPASMTRIMPTVYAALVLAVCPQDELTLLWKPQADVAEGRQFVGIRHGGIRLRSAVPLGVHERSVDTGQGCDFTS